MSRFRGQPREEPGGGRWGVLGHLQGLLSPLGQASAPDPQSSREAPLTRGHRPFPVKQKAAAKKDKVPPFDFYEEGSGGRAPLLPAAGLCRKLGPRRNQINPTPPPPLPNPVSV